MGSVLDSAWKPKLVEERSKPTVKQHLAAVRMVLIGAWPARWCQINPAHSGRGPKHIVKKGKTLLYIGGDVVRPERRRVVLAGASPDRVSSAAPGSRLQPEGEICPSQAECRKPSKERGANRRAATISERYSLVKLSAERCLGGPSRSRHGESNRQHPGAKRVLDLPGVPGGGTLGKNSAEQERPSLAAESSKGRVYKAGRRKSPGARRESERFVVPGKACNKTRWREGTLLWSCWRRGKREGMPAMANTPFEKARQLGRPAMGAIQVVTTSARMSEAVQSA